MKSNELRIGNLVMASYDGVKYTKEVVTDIFKYGINSNYGEADYDEERIKPIPLTEEWLIKFGFEKKDANIGLKEEFKKPNNYHYSLKSFGEYYPNMKQIEVLGEHPGFYIKCEHVHQLQNLYYALTGEELEIK